MKKRILAAMLAAMMVLSMAGCSGGGNEADTSDNTEDQASAEGGDTAEETEIQVFIAASLNTVMTELAEIMQTAPERCSLRSRKDMSATFSFLLHRSRWMIWKQTVLW